MTSITSPEPCPLNDRALVMLGFKADGIVDKEAAKQLGITTQAFTTATSRIYAKIGATNGAHAVAIALRNRWIP